MPIFFLFTPSFSLPRLLRLQVNIVACSSSSSKLYVVTVVSLFDLANLRKNLCHKAIHIPNTVSHSQFTHCWMKQRKDEYVAKNSPYKFMMFIIIITVM